MDSATLAGGLEFASATNLPLHSITVIRKRSLVLDAYFYPYEPGWLDDVASVTEQRDLRWSTRRSKSLS